MFASLDFVYMPTPDVDAAVRWYVEVLGAELAWRVRAMGTTVAAIRVGGTSPLVLLAGHLQGDTPVLVHRVDDYAATTGALRSAGVELHELEIPHGPCAVFVAEGGQRFAVYELTRPEATSYFDGRIDP
jgi:catechol 2,3-dioxygenase-like lactoylglutathione lyase family enzyme